MAAHLVKQNRASFKERSSIAVTYHHPAGWADELAGVRQSCPSQSRWLTWSIGSILRPQSKRRSLENTSEGTGGSNGGWRRLWKEPRSRLRRRPPPLASTTPSRRLSPSRLKSWNSLECSMTSSAIGCRTQLTERSSSRSGRCWIIPYWTTWRLFRKRRSCLSTISRSKTSWRRPNGWSLMVQWTIRTRSAPMRPIQRSKEPQASSRSVTTTSTLNSSLKLIHSRLRTIDCCVRLLSTNSQSTKLQLTLALWAGPKTRSSGKARQSSRSIQHSRRRLTWMMSSLLWRSLRSLSQPRRPYRRSGSKLNPLIQRLLGSSLMLTWRKESMASKLRTTVQPVTSESLDSSPRGRSTIQTNYSVRFLSVRSYL